MSFFNPAWHLVKAKNTEKNETEIWNRHKKPKTQSSNLENSRDENNNVIEAKKTDHQQILWLNVFFITLFHLIAAYTFIIYVTKAKFLTIFWGIFVGEVGGFGITAGVHRLWAHRSYKAKLPLKIFLLFCYTVAGQNDVHEWVRDHRVHHKFSETDADPHNSNRGLFFSHVGWLMMKKHPDVSIKGKTVDMSDIQNDPLITFHTKYFLYFKILCCFILPVLVPLYVWNETWRISFCSQVFIRYVINLNFTWSVNSLAHKWGSKPYDKTIKPSENLAVCIMAMGEGYHNYHHVFPWDYRAAELGNYMFNVTTLGIDFFAKIGWAYDLKKPSKELVEQVIHKRGALSSDLDGSKETSTVYE
ncbi:acyl-CoA Delta-9 desaturase-like [Planococcus citri]|uniref:acyl-CoA Delta-9 desaturase-like n=1 Tax=Planococcus citri TaxID=170843 RepID=UPI0031F81281